MTPDKRHREALRAIADIPLHGEAVHDPKLVHSMAIAREYDVDNDCYEPFPDTVSEQLETAVKNARRVLGLRVSR